MPLADLARAMAKVGSGQGLGPVRRKAASRLLMACMAEPWFTAGTGRFCTDVMTALSGAAYVKTGAEGVRGGRAGARSRHRREGRRWRRAGRRSGHGRDADAAVAGAGRGAAALAYPVLRNWNGIEVGAPRPAEALTEA